jgi:hypothetical protein
VLTDETSRARVGAVPTVVLLAAVLAAHGVSFVLVGSGALRLRGEDLPVADIDAAIEPDASNLCRLHKALTVLSVLRGPVPTPSAMGGLDVVSVLSSFGKLDSLLERGRLDWDHLRANASSFKVVDATVLVASAQDAWALRRAFKA